jgi:hypothetical protein
MTLAEWEHDEISLFLISSYCIDYLDSMSLWRHAGNPPGSIREALT